MKYLVLHTLIPVLILCCLHAVVTVARALPPDVLNEQEVSVDIDIDRRIGPVSRTAQKAVDFIRNPKNKHIINNPTLCFYCGRSKGKNGKLSKSYYKMPAFSKIHKCKTVDDIVEAMKQTKDSEDWTVDDWTEVSRALAQGAREKKVYALVANHVPEYCVWLNVEEPELQLNPYVEVIEVWTLDAKGAFVKPRNVKRKPAPH